MKQKISTEVIEIDRLNEEIAEYEELRSITTLGRYNVIICILTMRYKTDNVLLMSIACCCPCNINSHVSLTPMQCWLLCDTAVYVMLIDVYDTEILRHAYILSEG